MSDIEQEIAAARAAVEDLKLRGELSAGAGDRLLTALDVLAAPKSNQETLARRPVYLTPEYWAEEPQRNVANLRSLITLLLLLIFGIVILGSGYAAFKGAWNQVKDYLNVALPSISGLLGSAVGFYFGALSTPARIRPSDAKKTPAKKTP